MSETEEKHASGAKALLLTVLLWTSACAVVVFSVAPWLSFVAMRSFNLRQVPDNWVIAGLALLTFGFMLVQSPQQAARGMLRLKGVLALVAATLIVEAVVAINMGSGLRGFMTFAWYPIIWLASSVLGFAASRRPELPLFVATAGAWIAAVGGLLGYASYQSLTSPIVWWYADTAAQLRVWSPSAGEAFRAVGFDLDPNYYGILGVVVLAFVLSLEGYRWVRAVAAAGAVLVLALSGSRAAALAALIVVVVWAIAVVLNRESARAGVRDAAPVLITVVALTAALVLVPALSGGENATTRRFSESAKAAAASDSTLGGADALTGDRLSKWRDALEVYKQHPMGAFVLPESILGASVHNEYLSVLVKGGPLYLAVYVAFLAWVAFALRPAGSPTGGLTLSVGFAAVAATITASYLSALMCMAFYFIGWLGARSVRSSSS